MSLSLTLMKNCAVAEFGSPVRAMAIVYLSFFRPLLASSGIGGGGWFFFMSGVKPPPWIMKPSMTRWKMVPSYCLSLTYCRKLATVFGALAGSSCTTMSPAEVTSLTFGAACAQLIVAVVDSATVAASSNAVRREKAWRVTRGSLSKDAPRRVLEGSVGKVGRARPTSVAHRAPHRRHRRRQRGGRRHRVQLPHQHQLGRHGGVAG